MTCKDCGKTLARADERRLQERKMLNAPPGKLVADLPTQCQKCVDEERRGERA